MDTLDTKTIEQIKNIVNDAKNEKNTITAGKEN